MYIYIYIYIHRLCVASRGAPEGDVDAAAHGAAHHLSEHRGLDNHNNNNNNNNIASVCVEYVCVYI